MAIDMGRPTNRDNHIAHNLRKRCIKRNFEGIHDRFLKDPVFRESQLEHDRTEEVCIQMDKDAPLRHQQGETSRSSARQNRRTERAFCGPQRAEFTIVSNEIQYTVTRDSKLAGPRRSASQWINWHRKTTPTAHSLRSIRDIRKTGFSH